MPLRVAGDAGEREGAEEVLLLLEVLLQLLLLRRRQRVRGLRPGLCARDYRSRRLELERGRCRSRICVGHRLQKVVNLQRRRCRRCGRACLVLLLLLMVLRCCCGRGRGHVLQCGCVGHGARHSKLGELQPGLEHAGCLRERHTGRQPKVEVVS